MRVAVPAAAGEDHAHVERGDGDAHDGPHGAEEALGVVAEDLEVPGVPAARGAAGDGEAEALVAARVDAALLDLRMEKER